MLGHRARTVTALAVVGAAGVLSTVGIAVAGPGNTAHGTTLAKPHVVRNTVLMPADSRAGTPVGVDCPSGQVALSGGAGWGGGTQSGEHIKAQGPIAAGGSISGTTPGSTPVEWYASFANLTRHVETGYVWVVCV